MRRDNLLRLFPRPPRLPSSSDADIVAGIVMATLASAILIAAVGLLIVRLGAGS